MKGFLILSICLLFTHIASAEVRTYDDSALDQDLNFAYEEETTQSRDIASDDAEEVEEQASDDIERDVASENQETTPQIQYWEY